MVTRRQRPDWIRDAPIGREATHAKLLGQPAIITKEEMVGIMTILRFGYVGALVLSLAFGGAAYAQDSDEQVVPDPGNGDQTEMMDAQDGAGAMTDDQGMDEPMMDAQMDEPVDPAAPEADGMNGTMTDEPDMAEPADEGMQEDTGRADLISDSSERALVEDELVDMTCEELWIARNEIFDRNGYCFRSERGQAYFDNSDCTSDSQDILSPLEWENVELIKDVEARKQCN